MSASFCSRVAPPMTSTKAAWSPSAVSCAAVNPPWWRMLGDPGRTLEDVAEEFEEERRAIVLGFRSAGR